MGRTYRVAKKTEQGRNIEKKPTMNILILSKLSGNLWAGPNNSVPAQVKSLKAIDSVFWYNLNKNRRPEWMDSQHDCKNLKDYPSGRLKDLPAPFNHPDIVLIEECYCFFFERIIKDIQRAHIPYVIIPRSQLTQKAQKNKEIKKKIFNILYYNHFIKNAKAIQYLTENERIESDTSWNVRSVVIPNGTNIHHKIKESFCKNGINATYIGRIEIYQKGLDDLLMAVADLRSELLDVSFKLRLFGPDRDGAANQLNQLIQKHNLSDIVELHDAVFGKEKECELLNTDVFIMTSRFEGHPMGLIEALSYGIPCLVTDGTNFSKQIVLYNCGWNAGSSVDTIRAALKEMIIEKEKYNELGENALNLANCYSWDRIAEDSHKIYAQLLL